MKIIVLLLALTGCVTQPLDVNTLYRKDLQFKVDGGKSYFVGSNILERKDKYDFHIWFYKKPTKFVFTTCHRQVVFANPGSTVDYEYMPDVKLEQSDFCPIEMAAFDESGQHSWAMLDFRSGFEKLNGKITCNGEKELSQNGVSFCQAKSKLIQRIAFDVPVKSSSSSECPELVPTSTERKEFSFEMGRDKCLYVFKAGKDIHRLITFGYDDVILR